MSLLGIAILLTLAGLGICLMSGSAGRLANFFWWAGILIACLGLLLIVLPVLAWIASNLKQALGV